MRVLPAALLVLLAGGARPASIRFLEEFKFEDATSSYVRVSANRYFLVGYPMEKNGDVLAVRYYNIFDVATRTITRTVMPLVAFRSANAAIFKKTEMPTLVHYDGRYSTFTMDERPQIQALARYLCRFDHQTGAFSAPIRLGGMSKSDWTLFTRSDPLDRHVYYAVAVSASGDDVNRAGATSIRLGRVRLDAWKTDWEVTLKPYRGQATISIGGLVFNQDGTRLAFVDANASPPPTPTTHVHVLDVASGTIRDYDVPFRLFGLAFTRDGRSLLVSSRDGGRMARLDLDTNTLAATAWTPIKLHALLQTPSGQEVYTYVSETTVTVRRVADLKQVVSIPTRNLFPGIERILPSDMIMTTEDGKFLLAPIYDLSSFTVDEGFRLYEVPDDIDEAGAPGPVSAKIQADKLFNVALRYARNAGIRFTTYHTKGVGDATETFAPAVIAADGNVLLGGTRDISSMDLTKPRKKPVVACVAPDGKARWTREVPKEGFLDYEVASVGATADGGCVARVVCLVEPGQGAIERLVRFDPAGAVVWDLQFPGDGFGLNTPFVDLAEMRAGDVVALTGRIYPGVGEERKWEAQVDRDGRVIMEKTGE